MRYMFVLIAVCISQIAFAASWISIGESTAEDSEIFVDTASITESVLGRKAWIKHKYAKPRKIAAEMDKDAAGKLFTEMVTLFRFDCDQRTMVMECA